MLSPVNIKKKLILERNKTISQDKIVSWVYGVLRSENSQTNTVLERLSKSPIHRSINKFNIDLVEVDSVFHISQIKNICSDYRLRFLDTKYFKGNYPEEVITKINKLEQEHNTILDGFKIIAPSKLFRLDKADDPLLFAPMGNNYYYLIHQWGTDLHPLRKAKFWAIKNVGNLVFTLAAISMLLTIFTYPYFFKEPATFGYILMLFMFYFKGVVGFLFFFGAASGKNFSEYSWQSKYDKIS